ncbi:MAG: class I SAM-dependent methyltransferase, partial [Hyphomicrobiales bacterium]|nr:class I SAM-dependent methyltransferase [Hyphomicrobiales bacterium]
PHGLLAAFAFDRVDRRAIATYAFDYLSATTALGGALDKIRANGDPDEIARAMILRRTERVLSDKLFLEALSCGPLFDRSLEILLTAIRKSLLLDVPADRFEDKALGAFALALIRQCMVSDYVFDVSEEEKLCLETIAADWDALRAGKADAARQLMLKLLYEAPRHLVPAEANAEAIKTIRPRGLSELLSEWLQERAALADGANAIPAIGLVEDSTSVKVAKQYEDYPYPRWTSVNLPAGIDPRRVLSRFFPADKLGFMENPFRILVAGTGTGRQAIIAAAGYGDMADVLGIDLSRSSLAYAKNRANNFGIGNLRLAQADVLGFAESGEGPFDIIESIGVLHHMADPFRGWELLTGLLRPGGLMLIGLYSAVSRRNISALRNEKDFPGSGCSDDEVRQYRNMLAGRGDEMARLLTLSQDFYTLNEFRDLLLHEQERPIYLSEIEAFISQNGLTFRGFQLPPQVISHFLKSFPNDSWPGTLDNWARYEEKHPRCFDKMYNFWCEKTN